MSHFNGTMMQYFEWYLPADGSLWCKVKKEAPKLALDGITAVWLPPAYKGAEGINDVGYAVYDTYDLGEFNQKGSISTKYGTKEQYLEAIHHLHEHKIQVYGDIVLNHRIGADGTEEINAILCNPWNRNQCSTSEEKIIAKTKFNFEGRNNKYSTFKWNHTHFDGTDWAENKKENVIYRFVGKEWEQDVDDENVNYDYLMGADLDFTNNEVIKELHRWGKWYLKATGIDGVRLDAVKHIGYQFFIDWLQAMREKTGKELFAVGEYWHFNRDELLDYISNTKGTMSLFDVPLHFNFHHASRSHGNYDMRKILEDSLVSTNPIKAVTFVDNHDTQPGQALESWVDGWFKPIAYAIILLREQGYPCVFYGDYYGIPSHNINPVGDILHTLLRVRKKLAFGTQHDYFDNYNLVGWTREGDNDHKNSGIAVLVSDGVGGSKYMYIGTKFAGNAFIDITGHKQEKVLIDEKGGGLFYVEGGSVSVWIKNGAWQLTC